MVDSHQSVAIARSSRSAGLAPSFAASSRPSTMPIESAPAAECTSSSRRPGADQHLTGVVVPREILEVGEVRHVLARPEMRADAEGASAEPGAPGRVRRRDRAGGLPATGAAAKVSGARASSRRYPSSGSSRAWATTRSTPLATRARKHGVVELRRGNVVAYGRRRRESRER
jgi:hypothetical protein